MLIKTINNTAQRRWWHTHGHEHTFATHIYTNASAQWHTFTVYYHRHECRWYSISAPSQPHKWYSSYSAVPSKPCNYGSITVSAYAKETARRHDGAVVLLHKSAFHGAAHCRRCVDHRHRSARRARIIIPLVRAFGVPKNGVTQVTALARSRMPRSRARAGRPNTIQVDYGVLVAFWSQRRRQDVDARRYISATGARIHYVKGYQIVRAHFECIIHYSELSHMFVYEALLPEYTK